MGADVRLNLLLTPPPPPLARDMGGPVTGGGQTWAQTLTHLLLPLGVRTFEASSGPQAMEIIEKNPIHLAVVDSRLPMIGGLNMLRLIQKLHDQPDRHSPQPPAGIHVQMNVEQRTEAGTTQRRIEVRFDAQPAAKTGPVVILIAPPAPQQDTQLLHEALKFNAFSVLSEPVDVNLMLEVMARALRRFHQNQWPA